jgi:hypothetical protein
MGLLEKAGHGSKNPSLSNGSYSGRRDEKNSLPVKNAITKFHSANNNFQGLVFETYSKKISEVTSYFGVTIPLVSGKALILLPEKEDWELLTHRLSGSLKIKNLFHFDADSPEKALSLLSPYM